MKLGSHDFQLIEDRGTFYLQYVSIEAPNYDIKVKVAKRLHPNAVDYIRDILEDHDAFYFSQQQYMALVVLLNRSHFQCPEINIDHLESIFNE